MSTTSTDITVPEFHMGDRLAKALDVSGISVAAMAVKLGVSRQTIGNYLAGRTTPKLAILRVWSEETGVALEWLQGTSPRTDVLRSSQLALAFDYAAGASRRAQTPQALAA